MPCHPIAAGMQAGVTEPEPADGAAAETAAKDTQGQAVKVSAPARAPLSIKRLTRDMAVFFLDRCG